MIVECRNCFTKFLVDNSEIDQNGRMVRCSVCEYEWLHFNDTSVIKKSVPKKRNWLPVYFAFPIVLLCLILILQKDIIMQQHQIMERFYEFFGYHNIKDLQIKINDKITKIKPRGNRRLYNYKIPLNIRNTSGNWRYVPAIRIIARDSENTILEEYMHSLGLVIMPFSNREIILQSKLSSPKVYHISVQILNKQLK